MLVAGLGILLLLALPVLNLRLGFSDTGNYPKDTSTRKAYDLTVEGFGAGFNGPLVLATTIPPGTDGRNAVDSSRAVADTPGVAAVRRAAQRSVDPDGRTGS